MLGAWCLVFVDNDDDDSGGSGDDGDNSRYCAHNLLAIKKYAGSGNRKKWNKENENYENCEGRKSGRKHQTRTDSINNATADDEKNECKADASLFCVLVCDSCMRNAKCDGNTTIMWIEITQTITLKWQHGQHSLRYIPELFFFLSRVAISHKLRHGIIYITKYYYDERKME